MRLVDRSSLESWLAEALDAVAHGALPLLTAAHREPGRLEEWDALAEAWLWNPAANRASRTQGQAWLTTTHAAFPGHGLDDLRRTLRTAPSSGHHAPVLGAILARLGLGLDESRRLALFLHLRSLISTAIRLGLVGPLEAQGIQHRLAPVLEAAATAEVDLEDLATTAPLSELAHLHHDRLYSRLFAT